MFISLLFQCAVSELLRIVVKYSDLALAAQEKKDELIG